MGRSVDLNVGDSITAIEAKKILFKYFKQDPTNIHPIILWGPPGVGKSGIVGDIAAELFGPQVGTTVEEKSRKELHQFTEEEKNRFFKVIYLTGSDPTRLQGMPGTEFDEHTKKKYAIWMQPSDLPHLDRGDCERGIVFLDELASATPAVQVTAHRLIHERRVEEYVAPKGWFIIAASNRRSDKAVVYEMSAPLANRFCAHLTIEPDLDSWKEWAWSHNIRPEIISFLQWREESLCSMETAKHSLAFPTPRTWEDASKLLNIFEKDKDLLQVVLSGCVGPGAATELLGYIEIYSKLPDPKLILTGKAPMPEYSPDQANKLWALTTTIYTTYIKDPSKWSLPVINILKKLPEEFMMFLLKGIAKTPDPKCQAIFKKEEMKDIFNEYRDLFL